MRGNSPKFEKEGEAREIQEKREQAMRGQIWHHFEKVFLRTGLRVRQHVIEEILDKARGAAAT